VFVAGTELGPLGEHALTLLRRARVGFVFQAFNLVAALSAEQNVALPLRLAGRRPEPDRARAALTEMVYASTVANVPPELGGGRTSPSCAWPVPPAGRSCARSPPSPQWSWRSARYSGSPSRWPPCSASGTDWNRRWAPRSTWSSPDR
jgi:hypothetical protein